MAVEELKNLPFQVYECPRECNWEKQIGKGWTPVRSNLRWRLACMTVIMRPGIKRRVQGAGLSRGKNVFTATS
jgi:hypothetical protein